MVDCMEQIESLHVRLVEEDYDGANTIAVQLLSDMPKEERIQIAVVKGHIRCLLEQEKFVELKLVIEESQLQSELAPLYSYALYRTEEYNAVVSLDSDSKSVFQKHLIAQSLYHLEKSEDALQLYEDLLNECRDEDVREEIVVNLTAALLSKSIPYVRNPDPRESIVTEYVDSTTPCPVEALYNLATPQLVQGEASAVKFLLTALENSTDPSMRNEILHNLNWSQSYLSGTNVSHSPSSSTAATTKSSRLFAVDDLPTQKVTSWQSRLEQYNTAVSHLNQQNRTECQKICKHFALNDTDDIWWKSRIAVLRAYCDKKALNDLESLTQIVKECTASPVRDATLLYLEVHRSEISGAPLDVSSLPLTIQSSNGVMATRVGMNLDSVSPNLTLLQKADLAMNSKDFVQAAHLYEEHLKTCAEEDDPIVQARFVAALSHVDPRKAIEQWKEKDHTSHIGPQLAKVVNGAELEAQEIPRLKATTRQYHNIQQQESLSKSKKSRNAILRRRAKSKEAYLAKLEEKGLYDKDRPTKPDPERWIPQMERSSYYRKKKKGAASNKGGASQGGFSQKEALKLDVLGRSDGTILASTSGGPSTAHLSATVGGRKVGRKKK